MREVQGGAICSHHPLSAGLQSCAKGCTTANKHFHSLATHFAHLFSVALLGPQHQSREKECAWQHAET